MSSEDHGLTYSESLSFCLDSNAEGLIAPGCKEVGDISQGWMVVVPKYLRKESGIWEKYTHCVTFLGEMRSFLSLESSTFPLQTAASLDNFPPPSEGSWKNP